MSHSHVTPAGIRSWAGLDPPLPSLRVRRAEQEEPRLSTAPPHGNDLGSDGEEEMGSGYVCAPPTPQGSAEKVEEEDIRSMVALEGELTGQR